MISIEMTTREGAMTKEVIQSHLSELRFERSDTETKAFRDEFEREEVLRKAVSGPLHAA